ncbi:glycerophosphodiester phosphodiesterase family protein [Pseudorhodoplanes sp.]|uniref:glycerophosphodiester phosphodiesterase family protein n=1 Tax=Pseudorhodoplanes sp. TaxID=1934341 RepID=UPI002C5ED92C|nr:glycerophosphodiester phosphodiesterase family protein [Pseudorhodoplanes sp.]HWV53321.1 glycerophosphodiester phosphodiesterase family protein [Pseudorhodoplanes sp.]
MPGLDWLTARPVAHRGLHDEESGIVENTASAFSAAIAGQYAIECDLQLSADGEAMVFHDDELDRLTERSGLMASLTAAELKAIAFRGTAERMLTLGELCDLVSGRVTLVLEVKSHFTGDMRLTERVARVVEGYAGPVAAMSFDPSVVRSLRATAPGLPRGLVTQSRPDPEVPSGSSLRYASKAFQSRPHFLAWSVGDLPGFWPLLGRWGFGLPLLTWTVRSEADRVRAGRWADQMIFEGFRP